MRLEVMAVFDQAAKAFLPPFFVASEAMAVRQFVLLAESQPKHDFVRFGDQFTLYRFGSWDNETGQFGAMSPVSLGSLYVICQLRDLLDSADGAEVSGHEE